MRKTSGVKFTDLANIGHRQISEIGDLLMGYKKGSAENTRLYRENIAKDKNSDLQHSTKSSIAAADKKARDNALAIIGDLRAILHSWVVEPAPERLIAQLKIAKDFGLKLSPMELEAYAAQTNGNYTALRCLEDLATQSGYKFTYPTLEDFQQDLADIDAMFPVPSHCAPEDLIHEAIICASNKVYRGIDCGKPKAYDISYSSSKARNRPDKLQAMAERWDKAVQYTIEEIEEAVVVTPADEPKPTPDIATVEDPTNTPEAIVKEWVAKRNKANAEAKAIREAYTDKCG